MNKKRIGTNHFYSNSFASNGSVLPIGNFIFEIKLKSGFITKYNFTLPAPNSLNTDGYTRVYTEEYGGTVGSQYSPLIRRATIEDCTKDTITKEIQISFKVNDSRVYSGRIWFYDGDNINVGYYMNLRDYSTGIISNVINNGSNIFTNNTINIINIMDANISYLDNYSFNDIQKVVVVLTDGYQYESNESTFDCDSMSAKTVLKIK